MNWTGGRLQRHCIAAGTTKTRQKHHFAKVRRNLCRPAKTHSPIKWSALGFYAAQQPLNQVNHHQSQGDSSQILQLRDPERYLNGDDVISMSNIAPERDTRQRAFKFSSNDAFSEKTRKTNSLNSLADGHFRSRRDNSIAEKRRKILEKGDWVGTKFLRPVVMKFDSSEYIEHIGRRRPITENYGARFRKVQHHITSPYEDKIQNLNGLETSGRQLRNNAKIRIGGEQFLSDFSSSSTRSRAVAHSGRAIGLETPSYSDLMLLDSQEIQRQNKNTPEHCENFTPIRLKILHPYKPGLGLLGQQKKSKMDTHDNLQRGFFEVDDETENDGSRSAIIVSSEMDPRYYHYTDRNSNIFCYDREEEAFFSCSAADVQHPVPISKKRSTILRLSSPEIAEEIGEEIDVEESTNEFHSPTVINHDIMFEAAVDEEELSGSDLWIFSVDSDETESKRNQIQSNEATKRSKSEPVINRTKPKKLERKTESSSSVVNSTERCIDSNSKSRSSSREISRHMTPQDPEADYLSIMNRASRFHQIYSEARLNAASQEEVWRRLIFGNDAQG